MSYEKWRARLRGESVVNFLRPDMEDEGYYRKPLGTKLPNGLMNITGWIPVALFIDKGAIQGLIGAGRDIRDMTDDELDDESLWSYLVQNPVPYDVYKAVAEDGASWPDIDVPAKQEERALAQAEGQRAAENQPDLSDTNKPKAPQTAEEHRTGIGMLVKAADAVKKIDSSEEASVALGTRNLLAQRRLAADKAGKALYQPQFQLYKKLFAEWSPMVKWAKDAEDRIEGMILTFRQREREKVAEQQQKADTAAAEETERNARAADRAIANAEPEPPPEVEEPPPAVQALPDLKPTHGNRKLREEEQTFVEIVDEAQVATYFRGHEELRAVLHTLALRATKRGETVPGTTSRKGLV